MVRASRPPLARRARSSACDLLLIAARRRIALLSALGVLFSAAGCRWGYGIPGDEDSVQWGGDAMMGGDDGLGAVDVSSDGGADGDSTGDGGSTGDGDSTGGGGSSAGAGAGGGSDNPAGSGGDGGTSSDGGASNSGGAGAGGSGAGGAGLGGTFADFDPVDGYFILDASDSGGQNWVPSALAFTSSVPNPDGTLALGYRIDWFETTDFGILLGGEEFGVGTYDPMSGFLTMDQTTGWSSPPLDHYEATYDPATKGLIDGSWDTGNPGTFTAAHVLSGLLLPPPVAVTSSERSGLGPAGMMDVDMMTYWSSATNRAVGETMTFTLLSPMRLTGMRLLSSPSGNEATPSRLTVTCRDGGGMVVDVSDVTVSTDPMWKTMSLSVDTPVSEVHVEVTEIDPPGGNRIVVSSFEFFGSF